MATAAVSVNLTNFYIAKALLLRFCHRANWVVIPSTEREDQREICCCSEKGVCWKRTTVY